MAGHDGELINMAMLKTERLQLRPFTHDDTDFVIRLVNEPAWLRNIGDRNVHTPEQARGYIDKMNGMHTRYGHGAYRVALQTDDTPLGMAGLFCREGLDDADIGFALLPEHSGQGYALEAAQAVLDEGRGQLSLKRITAVTMPANKPSIKLLEKLGLHFVEIIRLPRGHEDLGLYVIEW